nr:ribonuclease H-like domain-containing protein [Tanacetum cinerariifolium]
ETSPFSKTIMNTMEDLLLLQVVLMEMCDKKNNIIFIKTECFILSLGFKLPDENQVLLKVPRKNNMYSFDLNNVVPSKGLTFLFANATNDKSNLWHRRLGHINFKTMNKLVKGNLFRGLPLKFLRMTTLVLLVRRESSTKPFISPSFNARTTQQNGFAERKNKTLIEAARTMFTDSLLPIPFWAEAVNTACYVLNKVLMTKPHNKTPYELLIGGAPIISFMRPFSCPVTILNTLDHLEKIDGKADERFLVGYSINSKAFRVYNSRNKKVEENMHVNFLENKPNVEGSGPEWLFDIDSITNSINYQPDSA